PQKVAFSGPALFLDHSHRSGQAAFTPLTTLGGARRDALRSVPTRAPLHGPPARAPSRERSAVTACHRPCPSGAHTRRTLNERPAHMICTRTRRPAGPHVLSSRPATAVSAISVATRPSPRNGPPGRGR